jgi:hypothetical protein
MNDLYLNRVLIVNYPLNNFNTIFINIWSALLSRFGVLNHVAFVAVKPFFRGLAAEAGVQIRRVVIGPGVCYNAP